jgi:hypothetical protein
MSHTTQEKLSEESAGRIVLWLEAIKRRPALKSRAIEAIARELAEWILS